MGDTLIPFWEPEILSWKNKFDFVEKNLHISSTFYLSPQPLKQFCLGLLKCVKEKIPEETLTKGKSDTLSPITKWKDDSWDCSSFLIIAKDVLLGKLLEFLVRKQTFGCGMHTWVYFWTDNFQILPRKVIWTISYLLLLLLKTRNLALYHLHFLVGCLVEGPTKKVDCLALKRSLVFLAANLKNWFWFLLGTGTFISFSSNFSPNK